MNGGARADSPDISDIGFLQRKVGIRRIVEIENAVGLWREFGDMIRELGQRLCPRHADRYGDLCLLENRVLDVPAEHRQLVGNADIDEGFVDRVKLDLVCTAVVVEDVHNTM